MIRWMSNMRGVGGWKVRGYMQRGYGEGCWRGEEAAVNRFSLSSFSTNPGRIPRTSRSRRRRKLVQDLAVNDGWAVR